MNRGALINLRHIIYDIIANFIAYFLCYSVFIVFLKHGNISLANTFLSASLYTFVFVLYGSSAKLYDSTTFYYSDRIVRIIIFGCAISTAAISTSFYFSGRAQTNRGFYLSYFIISVLAHLLASHFSFSQNRKHEGAMRTLLIGERESFTKFRTYVAD